MGTWDKGSQLNDELLEQIDELCQQGLYEKHILPLVNIAESTWYWWKREAKKIVTKLEEGKITLEELEPDDVKLLKFLTITKKGRAEAIKVNLQNIQNAGRDPAHWQASAWFLERVSPEEYGRKQTVKYEGSLGVIDVKLSEKENDKFKESLGLLFPELGESEDIE